MKYVDRKLMSNKKIIEIRKLTLSLFNKESI
jgi:hypothetical protein